MVANWGFPAGSPHTFSPRLPSYALPSWFYSLCCTFSVSDAVGHFSAKLKKLQFGQLFDMATFHNLLPLVICVTTSSAPSSE